MEKIYRESLTSSLQKHKNVPVVKIIIGMQMTGKKLLLEAYKNKIIKDGHPSENIIERTYSVFDESNKLQAKNIMIDISGELENKNNSVLFVHEIQNIKDWQDILLDLIDAYDTDIYMTSSRKIDSDQLEKLKGRYVIIDCTTLSFSEYLEYLNIDKIDSSVKDQLESYMFNGGLPIITDLKINNPSTLKNLARGIFSDIVFSQICPHHPIANYETFYRVYNYILDNLGTPFSVNKISAYMKQENQNIAIETIYAYLEWLEEACLINRVYRYDLKANLKLKTQSKYYLCDTIFYPNSNTKPIAENIIYLELKRRGFNVYIGKFGTSEISFFGQKRNDKIYIQILDNNHENNKIDTLSKINDHYPKYFITLDPKQTGSYNGIPIIHLSNFLLNH